MESLPTVCPRPPGSSGAGECDELSSITQRALALSHTLTHTHTGHFQFHKYSSIIPARLNIETFNALAMFFVSTGNPWIFNQRQYPTSIKKHDFDFFFPFLFLADALKLPGNCWLPWASQLNHLLVQTCSPKTTILLGCLQKPLLNGLWQVCHVFLGRFCGGGVSPWNTNEIMKKCWRTLSCHRLCSQQAVPVTLLVDVITEMNVWGTGRRVQELW